MPSYIRHRPTVLDELPLDVIRVHIASHLNYDERINLNQCLPPWDRLSRKMSKSSIEKHEQTIVVKVIEASLKQQELTSGTKKLKLVTHMFQNLQKPRYFAIIERHHTFRTCVISKINELIKSLIQMKATIELGVRVKLASELKNLRKKIDVSGPYTEVRYDHVEPLSFQ